MIRIYRFPTIDPEWLYIDICIDRPDGTQGVNEANSYFITLSNLVTINQTDSTFQSIVNYHYSVEEVIPEAPTGIYTLGKFNIINGYAMDNYSFGKIPIVEMYKTYGRSAAPINIDIIDSPHGYMIPLFKETAQLTGTFPTSLGGNRFILIGFSSMYRTNPVDVSLGCQIIFGFNAGRDGEQCIFIRSKYYSAYDEENPKTWEPWKKLPNTELVQSMIDNAINNLNS